MPRVAQLNSGGEPDIEFGGFPAPPPYVAAFEFLESFDDVGYGAGTMLVPKLMVETASQDAAAPIEARLFIGSGTSLSIDGSAVQVAQVPTYNATGGSTPDLRSVVGAPFVNPGGVKRVQVAFYTSNGNSNLARSARVIFDTPS